MNISIEGSASAPAGPPEGKRPARDAHTHVRRPTLQRSSRVRVLVAAAAAVLLAVSFGAGTAEPAVTISPGAGGAILDVSADNAANSTNPSGGAFVALGSIVITEGLATDFTRNQSNRSFTLTAPANWAFDTAATVTAAASPGASEFTCTCGVTKTATTITVAGLTTSGANPQVAINTFTVSGIRVKPTAGATGIGTTVNITRGGSFAMTGAAGGATLARVRQIPGAVSSFVFAAASPQANATAFTGTNTITARDQFTNTITAFNASTTPVVLSTTLGGALTVGGSSTLNQAAQFTSGVANLTTLGAIYNGTVGTGTFTATSGAASGTSGSVTMNPGVATKVAVTSVNGGSNPTAGTGFSVIVRSQDTNGNAANVTSATNVTLSLATGTGTLAGTLTGTIANGANQTTIAGVTYTKAEAGVSITATRTSGMVLTAGTSSTFTVNPGAATTLTVSAPASTTAGNTFTFTVTAKDANNNTATGYLGTVTFGTNDPNGTLPLNYTFNGGDAGVRTFTNGANYKTVGSRSLTATDTLAPTITGTANVTVDAAAASKLLISAVPASATAGSSFSVTVQSRDPYDNPSNVVAGTGLSLSASGTGTLSGNTATISAGTSSVTLATLQYTKAESITLTATRTSGDSLATSAASSSITINAGTLSAFLVEAAGGGAIGTQTVGSSFAIKVTAQDANANTVTSYNGAGNTVEITSSSALDAGGGTTATFTNGVLSSHSVTLGTSGSQSITATRTSGGAQSGTSTSFTVNPGTLSLTTAVSVTGTAKVGLTLTRSAATWSPAATGTTYQWRRCDNAGANCADISGETGTGYTLAAADLDQTIRVVETGSRASYNSATSTSAQTAVVAAGDIANTAVPTISGTAAVGNALSVAGGTWTPTGTSSAYQWRRCDNAGANCADISGETGTGYTLAAADLDQTIRVVETASKTGYVSASQTSSQTAVVVAGTLSSTALPSVTGTAKVGLALSAVTGTWTPAPGSSTYQWVRCDADGSNCNPLLGQTGASYTLVAADLGKKLRVDQTASKTAYNDDTRSSALTAAVAAGDLSNTGSVSISGTAKVGSLLTRAAATWSPAADSQTYQWRRCDNAGASCTNIAGATATTYTLVAADLGQTIRVVETASKTAYNDASDTSAQTAVVANGTFVNDAAVSITGTAKVGLTLTRAAASWTPAPDTRAYQWRRCDSAGASCANITGETGTSYTLVAADLDQTIRVVETASKTAYDDAGSTSAQTGVVAAGDLSATTPVSITGTIEVGQVLTRSAAAWSPAQDTRAYQWRRCDSAGASCANIAGETGTSYTLVVADVGQTIRVVETASKTAYNDGVSTSAETTVVPGGAVVNVTPPTISGTVSVGNALTRAGGTWTPTGTSSTYQWRRCDNAGANCANLSGETGGSYTLVAADLGQTIRIVETATKPGYTPASEPSAQTAVVAPGTISNLTAPSVSGTAAVGNDLTLTGGSWTPAGTSSAYQWIRCDADGTSNCGAVGGATGTTYTLVAADLGRRLKVRETASKTAYTSTDADSAVTAVIANGTMTNSGGVSITGTAKVGLTLTRAAASWTPAPDTRAYQWRRCDNAGASCANITGETGTSYTLAAADLDQTIRVVETASKTAYDDASSTSAQTAVVGEGTITNTAEPTISGSATTGSTLTASSGTWTPGGTTRTFQWVRCNPGGTGCADIGGETASTYLVAAPDIGKQLKVRETASKPAYTTMSADSALTATVVETDATPPTNTVSLVGPAGALLTGTTLYYRPASAGSFSLSSAVVDSGSGPASAAYPDPARAGWTHAAETVSTPAAGPYVSSAFSWTGAASGDYSYVVTAADAWAPANTSTTTLNVTEDSAAPAATILCNSAACPAGWFQSSPVSVTLAAPDAGAGLDQIRYTTDGSDPTILSGTVYAGAFNVAAEGLTTVKYRAFDRIGNDTGVQAQPVRIDTVAPQTAIDAAPAAATADTTPTFEFSANEAGSTFQYRLNGGSWSTSVTSPLTLGPLAEGSYTFEVRAIDVAGNPDASPASFAFTVDTTPADTTITSSPAASSSSNASFSFTASDAGPAFECSLDGSAFAACTSPKAYASLSETSHTFQVRAKDAAGNVDPTPASHAWTVDLTAPETTILTRPADPYGDAVATFTFEANEVGSTFRCRIDGGSWNACSSPFDTPSLADGAHTFDVEATDLAGNVDASPDSDGWTTDDTNPTGSVTSPASGANVSGVAVALASNSADSGSGVATVVFQRSPAGAGTWTNQATPWNTTLQADGGYDVRVVTADNAGNSFTSAPISVTVDNTAPTLSVTLTPASPVNLATPDPAALSATASDGAGSGVASVNFEQCSEDSATCASSTWTPLGVDTAAPYGVSWSLPATDGVRLLRVTATDNAGKTKVETLLITLDRGRPTGTVTPPANLNLRGIVTLSGTATDPAPATGVNTVSFQRSPAGAGTWTPIGTDAAAPYEASFTSTGVADGLYDLRVFTTDVAGNAEAAPATIQVRVDNTLPTGEVTAPLASANRRGTVAFTSDSADPLVAGSASGIDPATGIAFERRRQGDTTWIAVPGASWATSAADDGLWETRVTTTDRAGNAFSSAVVTFRIDNTAPTGDVTAPVADANLRQTVTLTSNSADPSFPDSSGLDTVVFERRPEGSGGAWSVTPASWVTSAADDGRFELRVTTTDLAGNSFTSPVILFRVDNTAPTGTMDAPTNGDETGRAEPPTTLSATTGDGGSGVDTAVFERSPAGAGTWTPTATPWNTFSGTDAVSNGSYDLRVTVTDRAGNTFSSSAVTILVDHTAPTSSAAVSPGTLSNAPVTVTISAGDNSGGSGVRESAYRVDGGSVTVGNSVTIGAPGDHSNDGSHVVQYFSTDDVGNVEVAKSVTVVIDTTAPAGSPGNPGDYLRGITSLTYTSSDTDIVSVQFQFSPAGMGAWSNIGSADLTAPYAVDWNTESGVSDGAYDLRVIVTDSASNVTTTLLPGVPKYVDNTDPTGTMTGPAAGSFVVGTAAVTATAGDGATPPASGVAAVRFDVKPAGAGSFSSFGTETAPVIGTTYKRDLDTTSYPDGPTELRVVVTDVAGNESTSSTRTVTIDNLDPSVTLNDPGADLAGTVTLGAGADADAVSVEFERRAVGTSPWLSINTDSDASDGFSVTFGTTSLADGSYELRAVATDGAGHTGSSAIRTVRTDNTLPTGSITAPAASATVGGPAVDLAADAADSGTGVASVEFFVKVFGSSTFASAGAPDSSAPFATTWDATGASDGAAEIRALVTDRAGNTRQTAVVTVTVDSTGPSVMLASPGAVLSGIKSLTATTGGGASRVSFAVAPAGSSSWTEIENDTAAPFAASLDTRSFPDGVYDLRAIGYDSFGNASTTPSVRAGVRFDNVAPRLVSASPADGSVVTSTSSLALTASEPVTIVGALLDGSTPPASSTAGNTVTYATGALADGLHVLSGRLEDASGTQTPFRVAVTVESTPPADRAPVEKSASPTETTTVVSAGGLATVSVPPAAWPTRPTSEDFMVIRVNPSPSSASIGGLTFGSQVIEVTAWWALAGTPVTQFASPIEIVIPNSLGSAVIPGFSSNGSSWKTIGALEGTTLPASRGEGYFRDVAGVHIVTRHLTFFALIRDLEPPTSPRDIAGVVAADGLTIRWIPGTDSSGELGNVVLLVNGEPYQSFDSSTLEAKLGAFVPGDSRAFTLIQYDAAGNASAPTKALRALPPIVGLGLDRARAALAASGFSVGSVREEVLPTVVPGTVVGPADQLLAVESSAIDLIVARGGGATAPQTKLVMQVANAKKLTVSSTTTVSARVKVSRPANLTATLYSPAKVRLYTWRLKVKAGVNILKLKLPPQVRKPGTYRIVWVARSGTETTRATVTFTLVGKKLPQLKPRKQEVEVVLSGDTPPKSALAPELAGTNTRIVAEARPDQAFALAASGARNVGVMVVDADAYGVGFIRDLHIVFPELRLLAIARRPEDLARATRAGASLALPRSTPARTLARAIARLAR